MEQTDTNDLEEWEIPRVFLSSYEWAKENAYYKGSLLDYVHLQYLAYRLSCVRYHTETKSIRIWLATYSRPISGGWL